MSPFPPQSAEAYARSVLERFANPFLRHELIAISAELGLQMECAAAADAEGAVPRRDARLIAFGFAALLWFYRGRADAVPIRCATTRGARGSSLAHGTARSRGRSAHRG